MKENILVRKPSDLTVTWAQKIVNTRFYDMKVSKIDIVSLDIGTTTRIRVTVEHNGPETLPRRWFVKFLSMAWRARLITGTIYSVDRTGRSVKTPEPQIFRPISTILLRSQRWAGSLSRNGCQTMTKS